ncbi:hypothetical protein PVAP13_1KG369500 [Panicum virgatum]|uniref:Embryo surrounding factor 1 brassicaceae domain-containing protein n=1 Tax=Panicum virgatum TaxID=38727 RepID=A0A8T0XHS6_PANVG|nr:hypothetical protein PVAP13_1KG369500 [Panicum virgatum]
MGHMTSTVMFVMLFAATAQCLYQLQEAGHTNTSGNATVLDFTTSHENKIVLIFCRQTKCGKAWVDCYCCINKRPKEVCYYLLHIE